MTGQSVPMLTGKGFYSGLSFDQAGQQIAFLSSKESADTLQPSFAVYHATTKAPTARQLVREGSPALQSGWWVSDNAEPYFSQNGSRLFFGTVPKPAYEKPDSTPDDERVVVDVWNWKDPYLQPMQLRQLEQERRRNFAAFVNLKDGKVTQLGNLDLPTVQVTARTGDHDLFVATNNLPYRQEVSWDATYSDIYLVNARTGQRERILEHEPGEMQLSPDGKFVAWYDPDQKVWLALSTLDRKVVNISKDLQVALHNELHDSPSLPSSYGSPGWSSDGRFLIYDAFDIWSVDPTGKTAPRSITE
jgi:hypothetical protein